MALFGPLSIRVREMYNNENLLNINGKNPGDYGRRLLRVLYTQDELKTFRKRLSDFLLEEERRDKVEIKRLRVQQESTEICTPMTVDPTSMPVIYLSTSMTNDE
ncbi:unnamed protein product [Didymodactylos carnosus]|uniref:Uncharacterized protein n=1 Tax=Didymodactylos carnosus TaxID=1234261 RepID=A0A814IYK2_9BILA|nr:unnamed protein product [Didymodactylos carnosus]CAF1029811.1 unnamed protein product [Didymodactylos carnosus]CAF3716773.1 unnamed protein product [Didymodactylos carnosus]CAF3800749.1 unnamed protein product [Didymodactylos carnosus]